MKTVGRSSPWKLQAATLSRLVLQSTSRHPAPWPINLTCSSLLPLSLHSPSPRPNASPNASPVPRPTPSMCGVDHPHPPLCLTLYCLAHPVAHCPFVPRIRLPTWTPRPISWLSLARSWTTCAVSGPGAMPRYHGIPIRKVRGGMGSLSMGSPRMLPLPMVSLSVGSRLCILR